MEPSHWLVKPKRNLLENVAVNAEAILFAEPEQTTLITTRYNSA